jgi:drug/metabolite transporter (DMT)-like permease
MTAVGLALLASACWGLADFCGGLLSRRLPAVVVLLFQQTIALAIVGAIIVAAGEGPPDERAIWLSLGAGAVGGLALGVFYRALSVGTMSIVAPISASGSVTVPLIVGLATGDRPSALQFAGLAVILVGVTLAARERSALPAGSASRQSIVLALIAAAGFGVYFTLSDSAADSSVLWLLFLGRCASAVLLSAVALFTRKLHVPARRDIAFIAGIGIADVLATGLYALAMTEGLLSIVAVVGALYPITTVLLARAVLHERLHREQAVGVVLAFTGVAAVAAG